MKTAKSKIRKLENKLTRHNTNHILHLILSIITAGIWLIIWIIVGINNTIERGRIMREIDKLDADQYTHERNLSRAGA